MKKIEVKQAPEPRNKTISFESTTPWNATGFYYTPRYPQSHRGKKNTYISKSTLQHNCITTNVSLNTVGQKI